MIAGVTVYPPSISSWSTGGIDTTPHPYKRHRFPTEIISPRVWLHFRFGLSYRDVEEPMAERGVVHTYEAARNWCRIEQAYANQ
jgi:putative transposase